MNINLIEENLQMLSNSDTTFENVQELAMLSIAHDYLQNRSERTTDSVRAELNDIVPSYDKYKEIKRKYQMGESSKESVINSLQRVCKEIYEFLLILYSNTDFQDERNCIQNLLEKAVRKINK